LDVSIYQLSMKAHPLSTQFHQFTYLDFMAFPFSFKAMNFIWIV